MAAICVKTITTIRIVFVKNQTMTAVLALSFKLLALSSFSCFNVELISV